MENKQFKALAVFGVTTGVVLEHKGFGKIREVFDFFCPGIMDYGITQAQDAVQAEILKQRPELKDFMSGRDVLTSENIDEWAIAIHAAFPNGIMLNKHDILPADLVSG